MPLDPELIQELKKPLGVLLLEEKITQKNLTNFIGNSKKIISVGDRTSDKLVSFGIIPSIIVVDGTERREIRKNSFFNDEELQLLNGTTHIYCSNPPGDISKDSIEKIKLAVRTKNKVLLHVNGEEDLLTLPFCLYSPINSYICYGQPLVGMVLVNVDESLKIKVKKLIDRIMGKGYDDTVAV